jgi:hypothetical protein
MKMLLCLRRALASLRVDVRGPRLLFCFFQIPPRKGGRKSLAVREVGKTGLLIRHAGCDAARSNRLVVSAWRRISNKVNSPNRWNERAGPPLNSANASLLHAGNFAGGNS